MSRTTILVSGGMLLLACAAVICVGAPVVASTPTGVLMLVRARGDRWAFHYFVRQEHSWDRIVRGVRSGETRWLEVAVVMHPVLDTEPGEEMLEAVMEVFDVNPRGALDVLLPTYGAELVCGAGGYTGEFARVRAERRLRTLAERGGPMRANRIACRRMINSVVEARP